MLPWPVSQRWGSCCLHLPSTGITSALADLALLITWILRIKPESSSVRSQYVTDGHLHSPPKRHISNASAIVNTWTLVTMNVRVTQLDRKESIQVRKRLPSSV